MSLSAIAALTAVRAVGWEAFQVFPSLRMYVSDDHGAVHTEMSQRWHAEWSDRQGRNFSQRVSTADAV